MKKVSEEQKQRLSLTLLFSVTILVSLILTTLIVTVIISTMVHRGHMIIGTVDLDIGRFILQMMLWSFGIGAVLTLVASRITLKPVNKFLDMIKRLASGEYAARLSYKGSLCNLPAIREMTDSVNTLAEELERTEILHNDFINNFSHEFKTPIVSIAGFAKVLKRGDLSETQRREYLDIIEEESMRLVQMSTNVLNMTKVERQTILTEIERYNLTEQIRTCVLVLEGKWTRKNIEMKLPEEEFEIRGNMELLKQVWINLLDNAIKFSSEYSPVEVVIRQDERTTLVDISNFCEDIPPEKQELIFSKFYQADESHATEGNGIGLAVVKKVVDLHGGTVRVTSQNGKTTFTVSL